jgi:hypothetical protein
VEQGERRAKGAFLSKANKQQPGSNYMKKIEDSVPDTEENKTEQPKPPYCKPSIQAFTPCVWALSGGQHVFHPAP